MISRRLKINLNTFRVFLLLLLVTALEVRAQVDFLGEGQSQLVMAGAQADGTLRWFTYSPDTDKISDLNYLLAGPSGQAGDFPVPGYWTNPESPSFAVARQAPDGTIKLHLLPRRDRGEGTVARTVARVGRGRNATLISDFDLDGDGLNDIALVRMSHRRRNEWVIKTAPLLAFRGKGRTIMYRDKGKRPFVFRHRGKRSVLASINSYRSKSRRLPHITWCFSKRTCKEPRRIRLKVDNRIAALPLQVAYNDTGRPLFAFINSSQTAAIELTVLNKHGRVNERLGFENVQQLKLVDLSEGTVLLLLGAGNVGTRFNITTNKKSSLSGLASLPSGLLDTVQKEYQLTGDNSGESQGIPIPLPVLPTLTSPQASPVPASTPGSVEPGSTPEATLLPGQGTVAPTTSPTPMVGPVGTDNPTPITETPTPEATQTTVATITATATLTPSATATSTPTNTATATATFSPTPTPTYTPTPTFTATPFSYIFTPAPSIGSGSDNVEYNLGTSFIPKQRGTVKNIRVYSLASDSGTHKARIYRLPDLLPIVGPIDVVYGGTNGWQNIAIPETSLERGKEYIVTVSTGDDAPAYTFPFVAGGGNGMSGEYMFAPANSGRGGNGADALPSGFTTNHYYGRDVVFVPFSASASETIFGNPVHNSTFSPGVARNLGTAFEATVSGVITAIRVYGLVAESGDHTGRIYRESDQSLVAGPFTFNYGGADGWQEFDIPDVSIDANTRYVVAITTGQDAGTIMPIAPIISDPGNNGRSLRYPATPGRSVVGAGNYPNIEDAGHYMRDVVFVPDDDSPTQSLFSNSAPAVTSHADSTQYNLGTAFSPLVDGVIKKIRVATYPGESGNHQAFIYRRLDGRRIVGPIEISYVGNGDWLDIEVPDVPVIRDNDYMVAVTTGSTSTGYSYTSNFFTTASSNGLDLSYPQNAGFFTGYNSNWGPFDSMPATAMTSNYFRDVVFSGGSSQQESAVWYMAPTDSIDDGFDPNLGTRMIADSDGQITAVRVFAVSGESGDHTVRIYRASDQSLLFGPATWNFTGSNSWQELDIASSGVRVNKGEKFVVAVSTTNFYGYENNTLNNALHNGQNLQIPIGGGVFSTSSSDFPDQVFNNSYYFRDIRFNPDDTVSEIGLGSVVPDREGDDSTPYNMGTVFQTTAAGQITHVRVFSAPGESGDHLVRIYRRDNQQVIYGPTTWNFGGDGHWIELDISGDNVRPLVGVEYVVAVSTGATTSYALRPQFFNTSRTNHKNILFPQNAGVFSSGVNTFPTNVFAASCYMRDIRFVAD